MKLVSQETTTTVTVNVSVELATQEEARDFLSYVRAYGKSGVLVDRVTGRHVPVRNIEKAPDDVDNIRDLILTIADEVDGITHAGIIRNAKELGYTINPNTLGAALCSLKKLGKIRVLSRTKNIKNRTIFIYQTVK